MSCRVVRCRVVSGVGSGRIAPMLRGFVGRWSPGPSWILQPPSRTLARPPSRAHGQRRSRVGEQAAPPRDPQLSVRRRVHRVAELIRWAVACKLARRSAAAKAIAEPCNHAN
jgi:hypothetical protein